MLSCRHYIRLMLRGACLALVMIVAACAAPVPPRAADHDAVIAAVLQDQPDIAADRDEHLREHPEDRGFLSRLVDHRLCVEPRTARLDEFDPMTIRPYGSDGPVPVARWDRPLRSYRISRDGFPSFLRRTSLWSICPGGTLRISNPRFEGQTARVFVELRCGAFCGGGGELVLRKVRGRWRIEERIDHWVA